MGLTLQILTKTNCCTAADTESTDNDDDDKLPPIKSKPITASDKNSKLISLDNPEDSFTTTIPYVSPRN